MLLGGGLRSPSAFLVIYVGPSQLSYCCQGLAWLLLLILQPGQGLAWHLFMINS